MTDSSPKFGIGTYSIAGSAPFAGLWIDGRVIAINALNEQADKIGGAISGAASVLSILDDWERNLPLLRRAAKAFKDGALGARIAAAAVPAESLHIHAPIEQPRQIMMTRANYRKHLIEMRAAMDEGNGLSLDERKASAARMIDKATAEGNPFFFVKLPSAVTGPYDPIEIPNSSKKVDWELELAVVIGRPARHVKREDAYKYVAGYCLANDISARDLLVRNDLGPGQDWISCKCQPGFMPMGPYMVPAEFVPDPHDLHILLKLNGKVMQDERTNDMIHDIPRLIEYLSNRVQLWPGDVISTGSPAGNGMQFGLFVKPGDVIEGSITGLGVMKNGFVAEGA
ncbi:MAG: fumarylacetoacetate hydrolase family protein [Burkholderiaceae bacterium]|nr:fumarylacetoacetate hydrolase family protein [Burkholderiaceae bacterium]